MSDIIFFEKADKLRVWDYIVVPSNGCYIYKKKVVSISRDRAVILLQYNVYSIDFGNYTTTSIDDMTKFNWCYILRPRYKRLFYNFFE